MYYINVVLSIRFSPEEHSLQVLMIMLPKSAVLKAWKTNGHTNEKHAHSWTSKTCSAFDSIFSVIVLYYPSSCVAEACIHSTDSTVSVYESVRSNVQLDLCLYFDTI